jgi:Heparinase II/III-like protein
MGSSSAAALACCREPMARTDQAGRAAITGRSSPLRMLRSLFDETERQIMRQGTSVFGLALAALLCVGVTAHAALPSPVKPTHPRILTSFERVAEARQSVVPVLSNFPAESGSIELTITPSLRTAADRSDAALIDQFEDCRAHLFVRYADRFDNAAAGTVRLQVALQSSQCGAPYVANIITPDLPINQASLITIDWAAQTQQLGVRVNGGQRLVASFGQPPFNWTSASQRFKVTGRSNDQIARISVTSNRLGLLVDRGPVDNALQRAWLDLLDRTEPDAATLRQCTTSGCATPFDLLTAHPAKVEDLTRRVAMAYLLSEDLTYVASARNLAGELLKIDPINGGEWHMRGRVASFGILYDWLYDMLFSLHGSMAQRIVDHIAINDASGLPPFGRMLCGRQTVVATPQLRCASEPVIDWDRNADPFAPTIANLYLAGGHGRSGVAKAAQGLLAIIDERPDVLPMLETLYRHFDLGFEPASDWVSVDGGHHMLYSYGSTYADLLSGSYLWQTALQPVAGQPVLTRPWQTKAWRPYLYALRADRRFPSRGDDFGPAGLNADVRAIRSFALYAAVAGGNRQARAFYDQVLPSISAPVDLLWDRLFFPRPTVAPAVIENLPTSIRTRNAGFVVMRDSWDRTTATVLDFKSTSFLSLGHQHLDQNSLSLFYKTPLLVDSGFYDAYGTSHWKNYFVRTIAHSGMVVFDPTETYSLAGEQLGNEGGQWFSAGMQTFPTLAEAGGVTGVQGVNSVRGVEGFADAADLSWVRGNASKAYAGNKLSTSAGYLRNIVMFKRPSFWSRPVVVVYDEVNLNAAKLALRPRILFQTAVEPLGSGEAQPRGPGIHPLTFADGRKVVRVDAGAGSGQVLVETLLPSQSELRKVGGSDSSTDFRFGYETPDAGGALQFTRFPPSGANVTPAALAAPDVGGWRIEVSEALGPNGSSARRFLHVLSVAEGGSTEAAPSASVLSAPRGTQALQLGGTTVVVFAQRDASEVLWVEPAGLAPQERVVVGLKPGDLYALERRFDPATGATQVVLTKSTAGTLPVVGGVLRVGPG